MIRPDLETVLRLCLERFVKEGESAVEALCTEYPEMADPLRERIEALREEGGLPAPKAAATKPPGSEPGDAGQPRKPGFTEPATVPIRIDRPLTHEPKRIGSPRAEEIARRNHKRVVYAGVAAACVLALGIVGIVGFALPLGIGSDPDDLDALLPGPRAGTGTASPAPNGGMALGWRKDPGLDHDLFFERTIRASLPDGVAPRFSVGAQVPRTPEGAGPDVTDYEVEVGFGDGARAVSLLRSEVVDLVRRCEVSSDLWRLRQARMRADVAAGTRRGGQTPWRIESLVFARRDASLPPNADRRRAQSLELPSGYAVLAYFQDLFARAAVDPDSTLLSSIELSLAPSERTRHLTFGVAIAGADHGARHRALLAELEKELGQRGSPLRAIGDAGGGPRVYGQGGASYQVELVLDDGALTTNPDVYAARQARTRLADLHRVARVFLFERGRVPAIDELLEPRRNGPPLLPDGHVPLDPWGGSYAIRRVKALVFEVYSKGPDGVEGSVDDVVFPDRK